MDDIHLNEERPEEGRPSAQELKEFDEFKRLKRLTAARNLVSGLELNASSATLGRSAVRGAVCEAEKLGIGSVAVSPCMVKAARACSVSGIKICACVSAFGGAEHASVKARQIRRAVREGAAAAEVTAPVYAVKEGAWTYVRRELKKLMRAARRAEVRLNLEAPLLTSQELSKLVALACELKIGWLCASSGNFGPVDDEELGSILSAVKERAAVKAEGAETCGRASELFGMGVRRAGGKNAVAVARETLAAAGRQFTS